jgi:hypothetical protein
MAFRTNYNQQRAERDRVKQARKEEKLRERQEEAARRKAGGEPQAVGEDQPNETPSSEASG